jgi:membrane protease YdiL (CAAX protease family)
MKAQHDASVDRKAWAILTGASALASLAVLPYSLSLTGAIEKANEQLAAQGKKPITGRRLVALAFLQGSVTFGLASAVGLRLSKPMGIGPRYLRAFLQGKRPEVEPSELARFSALGAASALLLVALDYTIFSPARKELERGMTRRPTPAMGLLASFYGGIAEEVLMRLGLQTLLAAGLRRLGSDKSAPPAGGTMWPAIALSNLAFGAGHLPATAAIASLTPLIVARALVLNSTVGVVCGYLYWHKSLEAGMLAHGTGDIIIHVIMPLLTGRSERNNIPRREEL